MPETATQKAKQAATQARLKASILPFEAPTGPDYGANLRYQPQYALENDASHLAVATQRAGAAHDTQMGALTEKARQQQLGYLRAMAREAPEGYEDDAAWTGHIAPMPGLAGIDLNSRDISEQYKTREEDRRKSQDPHGVPQWASPGANMWGFSEGTMYNDVARGIDPQTGEIVGKPKQVKVNFGSANLAHSGNTLADAGRQGQESRRQSEERTAQGGMAGNRAYSLMALRDYTNSKKGR